jgi:hypothetical protein
MAKIHAGTEISNSVEGLEVVACIRAITSGGPETPLTMQRRGAAVQGAGNWRRVEVIMFVVNTVQRKSSVAILNFACMYLGVPGALPKPFGLLWFLLWALMTRCLDRLKDP